MLRERFSFLRPFKSLYLHTYYIQTLLFAVPLTGEGRLDRGHRQGNSSGLEHVPGRQQQRRFRFRRRVRLPLTAPFAIPPCGGDEGESPGAGERFQQRPPYHNDETQEDVGTQCIRPALCCGRREEEADGVGGARGNWQCELGGVNEGGGGGGGGRRRGMMLLSVVRGLWSSVGKH